MKGSEFLKETYSSLDNKSKYVVFKIRKSSWKFWAVIAATVIALIVLIIWLTRPEPPQEDIPIVMTETVTTQDVGLAAQDGDSLALSILQDTGRMLGRGLAMLMDILNPQKIVIGSIFLRQEEILRGPMEEVIKQEALSWTREVCEVVPAGLGEQLGDYAALSVAGNLLQKGIER